MRELMRHEWGEGGVKGQEGEASRALCSLAGIRRPSKGAQVSSPGSRLILGLLEMLFSGFKIQCLD